MRQARTRKISIREARSRKRGDAGRVRAILEQEIRSERWQEGDRLPTERELCRRFEVARNTLRRALDTLEERKLIVRHVGRGTFKSSGATQMASDPFEMESIEAFSPADVMECRLIFEPGLVPHVVARATTADLDRMAECVKQGNAATGLAEFERWDTALHDAIADATHNNVAISMSRSLAKVRQQARWGVLKARSMTPERIAKLQAEHSAIVAALRDRDQSKAHALLRNHLLLVRTYMFGE
jgi:DNA-binding FadR family transcriptional regulator